MNTIPKYGRIQIIVPDGCDHVTVTRPDNVQEEIPAFIYQPTRFVYDKHGYETQDIAGNAITCFRYTPVIAGTHRYRAMSGGTVAGGLFDCEESTHPGYVGISQKDARYFATDDGHAFVPIGPNLCTLRVETTPNSTEHFAIGEGTAWMGMTSWKRWIKRLSQSGVNYVRLWLSSAYLDARTQIMGRHDLAVFNRLDAVMDILRENGIRAKFCLEHFRTFTSPGNIFNKTIVDPDTGRPLTDVSEWVNGDKWNERWMSDIMPYIARYQNDPAVFAWELWNENNCIQASGQDMIAFTQRMIDRIKVLSPRNMAVNSLGSYDRAEFLENALIPFRDMENMPFMQLHRYLDQGAPLEICHGDPVELVADAFRRIACTDKPCVLNETGAVNDCHTGPFRFYACDDDGLIFHDLTYAPLFCGSAASGHMWHWEHYIEQKNLWKHYLALPDMLEGIAVDEERFVPGSRSNSQAHILELAGRHHALFYIRNKEDNWENVLRDGLETQPLNGLTIDVPPGRARLIWLMNEEHETKVPVVNGKVTLPSFVHGCILRIDKV